MGWHFLIVDDEPIERLAMKKIIQSHIPDVTVCKERANGREAVEYTKMHDPDIIFMDIQMPGMDGIEAVRQIKMAKPNQSIIMVSAYDTFQYAQQVMREGVKEYLLKPSKKEDIIETVDRVLTHIAEERQALADQKALEEKYRHALTYIQSDWVTSLLQDQLRVVDSDALLQDSQGHFTAVYAMVVQLSPSQELEEKQVLAWYKNVQAIVAQDASGLLGPITSKHLPILLPSREEDRDVSDQHRGIMLAKRILQLTDKSWGARIGIGQSVPAVDDFSLSYHQAVTAIMHTSDHVHYLMYSSQLGTKVKASRIIEKEKQLIEELRSGYLEKSFEAYFNEVVLDAKEDVERARQRLHETQILLERLFADSGIDVQISDGFLNGQTIYQLREEAKALFSRVALQISSWRKETMEGAIDQAKRYIIERFKESLTLEEVAGKVGLSPYYFSKLFKEEEGTTFIEWLTTFRIEEAKKRLNETKLSLKEICYEVGYHDPNYFSRVFKKMTGMAPTDYRREQ
jgi:two-component system, response regulator YesN